MIALGWLAATSHAAAPFQRCIGIRLADDDRRQGID
jgi:hypothetical protein